MMDFSSFSPMKMNSNFYSEKLNIDVLRGLVNGQHVTGQRTDSSRGVKWVDGLRGLASFSVITSHLFRAFDFDTFSTADSENASMRFFQLPFIRHWPQGRIGVATFALLTGFVCGIKPLKQMRAGDSQAALATLGKAAFKRPMRLMLPGTIATIMAFFVCQMGLFFVASRVDSEWIRAATPQPGPTWYEEIRRLERNWRAVWTDTHNDYDDHQWTLLPLLKCSLYVYFTLSALATVQFKYRMLSYILLFSYFWQDPRPDNETFYCHAFYGLFLSDLSQNKSFQDIVQSKSLVRRLFSIILIIGGLFISSWPQFHPEWKKWPSYIEPLEYLFPDNVENIHKRYTSLGLMLTIFGIVMNNSVRSFLCTRPIQFLGKHSFAVYLTHGTIFKTVLIWMIYGVTGQPWDEDKKDADGNIIPIPRCGMFGFIFWIPIWIVIVYGAAVLWTTYVDTFCEHISQWVMKKTFESTEKSEVSSNMA